MDLDSNLFGLGLDSDSNLFGLGLDSDSNLFGLGLVLDSTKVDLTTALSISKATTLRLGSEATSQLHSVLNTAYNTYSSLQTKLLRAPGARRRVELLPGAVQHDSEEIKEQGERKREENSKSASLFYEACGDQIDYKSKVFEKEDFKEVSSACIYLIQNTAKAVIL